MTRTLIIAALLLTANCSRQEQPAPPAKQTSATPATPTAKAEVPLLTGDWKVSGPSGLTASFSGGKAVLAAGCLRRAFTYTQNRNAVAFTSTPGGSTNCGRSPSADQEGVFATLGDANLAVFGANGGEASLSGLSGTLQLERR